MHNFQGYIIFPGLSGSWNFQEKMQDFPGGMGTLNITLKIVGTQTFPAK